MDKDFILSVKGGGGFGEYEILSEFYFVLVIWEVKGGEDMLIVKV